MMCSWKGLLLLACTACLVLNVASDDVQVDTEVSGSPEAPGAPESTGDPATGAQAIGDASDSVSIADNTGYGCAPRCKNNEVYNDCKNDSCTINSCSELGFPINCDKECKPGCVCKSPLLRAQNGACIERDQCPSCGGDPNAKYGCGSYCINCSNYKNKPKICPIGCIYNGCECKPGFIYDRNIKKCVVPTECTPTCGLNEVYSSCVNGGCDARNCSQVGQLKLCIDPVTCYKGCVCATGYLRASNGTCVPTNQCGSQKCPGQNEYFDTCIQGCSNQTCDSIGLIYHCPIQTTVCKTGCRCNSGYYRNSDGVCVEQSQCPPSCGLNEVYSSCTNGGCDARNCSQVGKRIPCPRLKPEYCIKGCVCAAGYLRASNGKCVPKDQCGTQKCPGQNEYFDTCIQGCSNQTCDSIGQIYYCPIQTTVCKTGCRCNSGYYRNSDGVCVEQSQCPPTCGLNEVYSSCTNGGCDARNCSQVGKEIPCPKLRPESCIKGCVCAAGYLRASNGKCVPKDQCGTPKCTKPNEVYDVCPAPCPPRQCNVDDSTIRCAAPPKPGDPACKPGCRCAGYSSDFARNATGVCVPRSQCEKPKKCNKPNEVYDSCPAPCPPQQCGVDPRVILCAPSPKYGDPACQPGCKCIDGYVRNAANDCILKNQCPQKCGDNEYFETCISGCSNQTCDDIGRVFSCPALPAVCRTGCRCNPGFWRNKDNKCVPENQCPSPPCPAGEVYNRCPTVKCDGDYCPKTRNSPLTCPVGIICDPPRCTCGFNSHRDRKTGKCIATSNCPPFPCNGPNEEYQPCPASCPGENCTDYINDTKCPLIETLIALPCIPQCKCKTGYFRNADGVCILGSQCAQKCGVNEYFETCISGCSNQTCDDIGKVFKCPADPAVCRTGCRCNPGFWRNKDNKCVPENQCPSPPCPAGEVYNRCPTVKCDGDYCPKTRNSPLTCPVGIICDPPRCTCGFNSHRDRKTGKCIATSNCPPFPCNGPYEEYQPCPASCPGENCTDYINDSKCPPFRIGIVVPCRPQCKCKTGYFRNADGVCILGSQCGPKNCAIITTPAPTCDSGNSNGDTGNGVTDLQTGVTDFNGDFLYERMKEGNGENTIISAYSVFTPLSQLALYAVDATLTQLLTVLNVKSKEEIRSAYPALAASFKGQTNVSFDTAAKVYSNVQHPLSDAFIKDSEDVFDAEAENIDFSKATEAASIINSWVENKTNDLIHDLVTPDMFSSLTRLVLVNAIYYKASWQYAFNINNTKDADFFLNDGSTKKTKLMYQQGNFQYGEDSDLDCKMLVLPYQNNNFTMLILLPNTNDGALNLAEKVKGSSTFNKINTNMRNEKVQVYIPRFEIQTTTDLSDILTKLGVSKIFDKSDSGLTGLLKEEEPVYVSEAIQKAYIKTDETGSEAAAANAVVVTTRALPLPPPMPKVFKADRAFLYYIRSGSIVLFSGVFYG